MITWLAIILAIYFIGFVCAGVYEYKTCTIDTHRSRPDQCGHPFVSPMPLFWVVCIPLLPWFAGAKLVNVVGGMETLGEKRERRKIERDEKVRVQARRIKELESQLGIGNDT